eukprot:s5288_g4.t1
MIGRVLVPLAVLLRLLSAERTSVRFEQNFRRAVHSYLGVPRSRVRLNDSLHLAEDGACGHAQSGFQSSYKPSRPNIWWQASVLPGACPDGILQLSGKYKVTEATTIPGPCQVTGLGELYLDAPITIRGDSSFLGQVSVKATRQTERLYHATMDGPCLTITGSFILHPGARLHFESCRNGQSTSEGSLGGGLRVDADMDLRGGHLRFENCRADGDEIITGAGGAIYVGGHFRNKNSTIEACNCSGTTGGTIRATKMEISGGLISINSSLSILGGGAITAKEQLVMLGGRVAITGSESSGTAGAIFTENLKMAGVRAVHVSNSNVPHYPRLGLATREEGGEQQEAEVCRWHDDWRGHGGRREDTGRMRSCLREQPRRRRGIQVRKVRLEGFHHKRQRQHVATHAKFLPRPELAMGPVQQRSEAGVLPNRLWPGEAMSPWSSVLRPRRLLRAPLAARAFRGRVRGLTLTRWILNSSTVWI